MSLACEGETEYAVVKCNRSGQDAGEIDYAIDVDKVESLTPCERTELCTVVRHLYEALLSY